MRKMVAAGRGSDSARESVKRNSLGPAGIAERPEECIAQLQFTPHRASREARFIGHRLPHRFMRQVPAAQQDMPQPCRTPAAIARQSPGGSITPSARMNTEILLMKPRKMMLALRYGVVHGKREASEAAQAT